MNNAHVISRMRWAGVCLILACALARILTTTSRVPYWDIDPVTNWTPDTTRTPAMGLLMDALVWLGSALIVWSEGKAGRSVSPRTGALALLGCLGVALHGFVLTPLVSVGTAYTSGDFNSLVLGSAWAAGIIGAWAFSLSARDPAVKRVAAAALLGVAVVLASKGAMQFFVDHPRLVAEFNEHKDAMLAAQGFTPGSATARLFERRLLQPEATGWFGLSNVYGSIMAACTAGLLALAWPARTAVRARKLTAIDAALLWIAFLAAVAGLVLSQSKGAIVAGVIGCALALMRDWVLRRDEAKPPVKPGATLLGQLLRWTPILLPVLVIGAVCLRGVLGDRLSELSLYFRWQYLLGAARIFVAHPWLGVGPAGFKDQYLLFKVPTNPEEVDSPHCLPADWLATLGVIGFAWLALWAVWLWKAGTFPSPLTEPRKITTAPEQSDRSAPTPLLIVIFCVFALSLWCESALYLAETLLVMLVSGVLWWFVARAAMQSPRSLDAALFAATAVIATHVMIEVSGVMGSSAAWVLLIPALAAAGKPLGPTPRPDVPRRMSALFCLACSTAFIGLTIASFAAFNFERWLKESAATAASAFSTSGEPPDARELDRAIELLPPRSRRSVEDIRQRLRLMRAVISDKHSLAPPLLLLAAEYETLLDIPGVSSWPRAAETWVRAGRTLEFASVRMNGVGFSTSAARAWSNAAELDPYGLLPPTHLARLYASLDKPDEAAQWPQTALRLNENLRLDPLKQLTEAERLTMETLARPGGSAGADPAQRSPAP